jgi:5-methyltetrahydrofolate--homocysteine methyltransferase
MRDFLARLKGGDLLLADGATGTNLQRVGLPAGAHTEDWIFDQPQKILELERAFVEAGADIVLTCTFGATRPRLLGSKYPDKVDAINQRAAELARHATSGRDHVLVGGSIGPLGQLLSPYGPLTAPEARAAYAEQARALSLGGVDLLVIETQFSLDEATAAVEGVQSVTDSPLILSFSFDRGTRTIMGVRPADAAQKCRALGTALIGANCGTTLQNMQIILQEYAAAAPGYPLWAKPNAGMPRIQGTDTFYDVTPEAMADFAAAAVRLGARVVGGCCGSTPEHVRAMAQVLKKPTRDPQPDV